MNILMIVLRLVHVLSGVFWAGATFVFASHVTPAVKATGPEGQKFMAHLSGRGRISDALGITGALVVISGLTMYFLNRWHLNTTLSGIALTLGALLGLAAFLHGAFVQRRAIDSMKTIGMEVAASGGPPSPEQMEMMGKLAGKIERNGTILAYTLGVTVILMGIFQYL